MYELSLTEMCTLGSSRFYLHSIKKIIWKIHIQISKIYPIVYNFLLVYYVNITVSNLKLIKFPIKIVHLCYVFLHDNILIFKLGVEIDVSSGVLVVIIYKTTFSWNI